MGATEGVAVGEAGAPGAGGVGVGSAGVGAAVVTAAVVIAADGPGSSAVPPPQADAASMRATVEALMLRSWARPTDFVPIIGPKTTVQRNASTSRSRSSLVL